MLFHGGWLWLAQKSMEAALRRLFPRKPDCSIRHVAECCLRDCEAAWQAYEAEAAAALLDLLDFICIHELPMPCEVAAELAFLAKVALTNEGLGLRGPGKHPVGTHHAALVRRLRHEHVAAVMHDAEFDRHEDEQVFPFHRLTPEALDCIRAERTPASEVIGRAVGIAIPRMPHIAGAKHVTPQAIYRDWLEVGKARESGGAWPGPYYLPTAQTCEALGWGDLSAAFLAVAVTSDAPRANIV